MLAGMRKNQNISCAFAIGLCLLSACAWCAEPTRVAMTPEHWKTTGNVEFLKHNGSDALELKPGDNTATATPLDLSFRNGTIEFDVDKPWSMGTGIAFRREKDKSENFEYFYLRPQANCAEAVDCIQYAPQTHGVLLWDVLPQYQSPAPLREGEWNHVKLVVSGQLMNIFVNGAKSPTLKVGRLEGDSQEGGLSLAGHRFQGRKQIQARGLQGWRQSEEQSCGDRDGDAEQQDRSFADSAGSPSTASGVTIKFAKKPGPDSESPPSWLSPSSLPTFSVGDFAPFTNMFIRCPDTTNFTWFHSPSRNGAGDWYCGRTSQSRTPWVCGAYCMQSTASAQLACGRR